MSNNNTCYVIANFGGPRNLTEIRPFLTELLTDQDVVRTGMPQWLHNIIFRRTAKKRTLKVSEDYKEMGGKSPIYSDTEAVASLLRNQLSAPILTFHRYLVETHEDFIQKIKSENYSEIIIFPMFPQFTYATTGSIARWFSKNLPASLHNKIRWVKSYPTHPAFTKAYSNCIRDFLIEKNIPENDVFFIFSSHGIPKKFVEEGDLYQGECEASFKNIMKSFDHSSGILAYQSKFGPGEWLKPYTIDVSKEISTWSKGKKHVVFVPISFTSDHLETLIEIEKDYVHTVKEKGFKAFRVPALNLRSEWIQGITEIIKDSDYCNNQMLIRK
jgi:protoporphyrin/coproporphyrin ferrochelatase